MKIVKLLLKLLVCYIAFAAAVWGIYFLCSLLPSYGADDMVYPIILYAIIYMIPALLAFGYSLLVYAVLKNSSKRVLIALLNGVVMTALSIAIILIFKRTLGTYIIQVPASCVLSIIMPMVLLALRPKSVPQPVVVPEAAEESK